MNLGEKIKEFRKKKNLTQKEFAKEINRSERMIQKYESGEVTPSIDVLGKISDILDVDFFELLNGINVEISMQNDDNLEQKSKIDNLVLSIEKNTAVKKWIRTTPLKEMIEGILLNNFELENLRNNINTLSDLEGMKFKKINDIPLETYNMEACAIVSKYKSMYINNLINKILLTISVEEDKLSNLLNNEDNYL